MARDEGEQLDALARRLDGLDYYEVLGVPATATPVEIRRAYYALCRRLHPDALGALPEPLRAGSQRIAQRLNESYCVLRDPGRRRAYDGARDESDGRRMPLVEVQRESARQSRQAHTGHTPQGRQYAERALACLRCGDRVGAIRNLQTALTFEPGNEHFQGRLDEARTGAG